MGRHAATDDGLVRYRPRANSQPLPVPQGSETLMYKQDTPSDWYSVARERLSRQKTSSD